jgi:hypothetical protein
MAAALPAPYRHARLSAMKLAGDPNNPVRIRDDATLEELRAEMMKHLGILIDGGLIDLEALPALKPGISESTERLGDAHGPLRTVSISATPRPSH